MANSLLALAVIVVATTQVAFATYHSKGCDPPHRIDYGGYTPYKPQYSIGSKIKFHCDKGYKIYGASWTVCKWDKRSYWAHPLPICKRRFTTIILLQKRWCIVYYLQSSAYILINSLTGIGCPYLKAPQYGKLRIDGHGLSSVAYYSCDYGYSLHGPSSRKCLHDGSWYGNVPVCRPKKSKGQVEKNIPDSFDDLYACMVQPFFAEDCPRIYAPKYGSIKVAGYGPGSLAYYSCDYGYDIYGPSSRKCQHDGSWYGNIPVCRPKRSKFITASSFFSQFEYLKWNILQGTVPDFMLQNMENSGWLDMALAL